MVSREPSPLFRVTVVAEAGAVAKVTGKGLVWPGPTRKLAGRLMVPAAATVMAEDAWPWPAELAVMVAAPPAFPVTAKVAVLKPCGTVTDTGTEATLASLEMKLTSLPPKAAAVGSVTVRFCVAPTVTFKVEGLSVIVPPAFTWTACVALLKFGAVAVILALPALTPVICGWVGGCVWPASTVTVDGEMVTREGSLLAKLTTTPPGPAAVDKVRG